MAGIKNCLQDISTKLATLQVANQDGQTVPLYVRIFNNQIRYEKDGKGTIYPKPAAFIEVVSPATYEVIGQMYRSCDLGLRIHLAHEFMDAADGTMEQDLVIFAIRDAVIALLTGYAPTGCGPLNCMMETQDYEHDNVYEMVLEFVCNFTDAKGSPLDDGRNVYTPSVPPLTLEVDETTSQGGGQVVQQKFLIQQ